MKKAAKKRLKQIMDLFTRLEKEPNFLIALQAS